MHQLIKTVAQQIEDFVFLGRLDVELFVSLELLDN